ncbi:MAG: hypothetical protein JWM64_1933 [Frankiales bacterium]|nr:hypothetical protein [Frankiales bacterium]
MKQRLAGVPAFTLGFVLLSLLQAAVDRVDPTSGQVERLLDLLLLAFAVSGLVVALTREPEPVRAGSALTGVLLRAALALASLVLAVMLLARARVNGLADLQFVVALLLLALTSVPYLHDRSSRPDVLLARYAVPAGLVVLAVSVPVVVSKLADLR